MNFTCRICANSSDLRVHTAREMMFGSREDFEYIECGGCGTLQIAELPTDLARHYPPDYMPSAAAVPVGETMARRIAARFAGRYLATGRGRIGKWVVRRKPWLAEHFPPSLRDPLLQLGFSSRILDVGCGRGSLLRSLHHFGFRSLAGADKFIPHDLHFPEGITVRKCGIHEIEGRYDLVMLHHSFEHLKDPAGSLAALKDLLAPGGTCLVRMPLKARAWEVYGTDWVQLDPPRHLFIFTEQSFRGLAAEAGLRVERVVYDSTEFQFWGSEQYRRDIPLTDPRSLWIDPRSKLFSESQIAAWRAEAEALNAEGRGDMACFYLRPAS
jgi:SAM-dependent methyltransferase